LLKTSFFFLFLLAWGNIPLFSDPVPNAPIAFLMDFDSGAVLLDKNGDELHSPASLTKMVSLYIFLDYIHQGLLDWDTLIPVLEDTAASAMPPDSSLMFLEKGHQVDLEELLLGLAVVSGNDASYTLARFILPSIQEYVQHMNNTVRNLGFKHMVFYDPSGYDSRSLVTAREMAQFARIYIQRFPEALEKLHRPTSMTYPRENHLPQGFQSKYGPIVQNNRNNLLAEYPGVDGLKTGFIDEAGFNFLVTAQRNGKRLIGVLMGIQAPNIWQGVRLRAKIARDLLDYGFQDHDWIPTPEQALSVPLLGYTEDHLLLRPRDYPAIPVHWSIKDKIQWRWKAYPALEGNISMGRRLGKLFLEGEGKILYSTDLVPGVLPEKAPWYAAPLTWFRSVVLSLRGMGPKEIRLENQRGMRSLAVESFF